MLDLDEPLNCATDERVISRLATIVDEQLGEDIALFYPT
jgi:hypothetical protein